MLILCFGRFYVNLAATEAARPPERYGDPMGKRFSCIKDCPLKAYSRTLGRCSIRGQIVAPTIKGGLDAVKWMGRAYICKFDPKRAAIMKLVDEWEATVR